MSTQNTLARSFKALHTPHSPLVLTNIWDALTAQSISSLPGTTALATASAAIALAAGVPDQDLDLATNLRACSAIARVARQHNLPLTVDMQDGYGAQLEDGVRAVIALGVVGINLEDLDRETDGLYSISEACARIQRVMCVARELGVPDFVVNARTDVLISGGTVDDAIERGKAYLDAGAFNVFVWGGRQRKGWNRTEVQKVAGALGGRLNVILVRMDGEGRVKEGLSVSELREIGVCRISVGPQLMRWVMARVAEEAGRVLAGEKSGE
jgi:2-methylisocitrate lyase-like PEP mutase family enzyme